MYFGVLERVRKASGQKQAAEGVCLFFMCAHHCAHCFCVYTLISVCTCMHTNTVYIFGKYVCYMCVYFFIFGLLNPVINFSVCVGVFYPH